jgi:hypothetical protein
MRNQEMAVADVELVDRMAKRHSVSPAAVEVVLAALRSGGGRMAQFSHADFGGMSQWSPGMSMVGDMFNTQLKAKLDALCTDIAAHLDSSEAAGGARAAGAEVSYRSTAGSAEWWPAGSGRPGAVGAQNDLRYAVFPETRRLVIDDQGAISVYDTAHHRIFGVAQAQSAGRTLTFTSQDGTGQGCRPAQGNRLKRGLLGAYDRSRDPAAQPSRPSLASSRPRNAHEVLPGVI